MDKWEVRRQKLERERKWKQEESNKRAELYPLRIAVNTALKRAGIPHSVTHYSSRVRGWPISTSEGWETESFYWSDPKHIRVSITAYVGGVSSKYNQKREDELVELAKEALKSFEYVQDGSKFEVYRKK